MAEQEKIDYTVHPVFTYKYVPLLGGLALGMADSIDVASIEAYGEMDDEEFILKASKNFPLGMFYKVFLEHKKEIIEQKNVRDLKKIPHEVNQLLTAVKVFEGMNVFFPLTVFDGDNEFIKNQYYALQELPLDITNGFFDCRHVDFYNSTGRILRIWATINQDGFNFFYDVEGNKTSSVRLGIGALTYEEAVKFIPFLNIVLASFATLNGIEPLQRITVAKIFESEGIEGKVPPHTIKSYYIIGDPNGRIDERFDFTSESSQPEKPLPN